ncbi:MAG: transcriptional regulator, partial [Tannerellaceae bacterium]|nr:transcriptional regulator [Tannerellaceae bacterium]
NDIAWEQIFEEYRILDEIESKGRVSISSADINKYRGARLMTKFDHRSQLPKLFVDSGLSILPTSRGTYEIGTFETFCKFNEEDIEVTPVDFPNFLESVDYRNITSEATAINCAFISKILHDFLNEDSLLPTVSGRMSSSLFDFKINSTAGLIPIKVNNSQIEIDGGYEGNSSLTIIEAKNYISDDFLVRQLYYPYRLWSNKVNKRVRPIYLTYSNGIFHLREYEFVDLELYNSIQLVQHKKYAVQDGAISVNAIRNILESIKTVKEPELPFPQADSFERVINLCELLKEKGFLSKEEITQNYDFDLRQTDYYSNAAKYLQLIEDTREGNRKGFALTKSALTVFNRPIVERQLEFVKLILSHEVFKITLKGYFDDGHMPSKNEVAEIMRKAKLYNIGSEETYRRRASTVISWVKWILDLVD